MFDMICDVPDAPIHVSTLIRDTVILTHVHCSCIILFIGIHTWEDLMILDMDDFDIILCMIWLSSYNVVLNCNTKSVTLEILERKN